jgi:uncharacterized protein YkwD
LKDLLSKFDGDVIRRSEGKTHLKTKEGHKAVEEAIAYLEKADSIPTPLKWNEHLAKAAKHHVDDTGALGLMQHESSKGKSVKERISEHGKFVSCYGENLSFHCETAEEVLSQLIIDDGVPERGHRLNIFNKEFKVFGCFSGGHKDYDFMTCMDLAAGFVKAGEEDPIEKHIDLFLKEEVEFEMPTEIRSWK